jgi:hypothetical protein
MILKTTGISYHHQNLMERAFILWKLEIRRMYIITDFYNEDGPVTLLEPPSKKSYEKKFDFERSRISEWLLS